METSCEFSQDGSSSLKPEVAWTDEKNNEALGDSKALNVIFNAVDTNMFRLINTCTEANDAWEILEIAHEGTSKIRMSRLQLLAINYENLIMDEDESISDFIIRLHDIPKSSFPLAEKMSEVKLAKKNPKISS